MDDSGSVVSVTPTPTGRMRPGIKIQDGCDNRCTYCIVWKARGASRSMGVADVVARVRDAQSRGAHEVVLTGINLGRFDAVAPDGTLYPCHRFVGMEKWALGRLEDGPDADRCKAFWRAYRAATKEACAGCWAYRVCGGPCPWEAARAVGAGEGAR